MKYIRKYILGTTHFSSNTNLSLKLFKSTIVKKVRFRFVILNLHFLNDCSSPFIGRLDC